MKKLLVTLGLALMISSSQLIFAQEKDANDKTIFGGVVNGRAISLPAPEYPPAAQAIKARGRVQVQIEIAKDGSVSSSKIISGHPLLRNSSLKAARSAKFKPTLLEDKPVKVRGVIIYVFGEKPNRKRENPRYFDKDILNARALKLPAPEVSEQARRNCLSGYVEVLVSLDSKGNVTSSKAVKGHPMFRKASEKAAMRSKFKTNESTGTIIYNFDFSDECKK